MSEATYLCLEDKIVVIAGGAGLIGREISRGFIEQGANVIIASRNEKKGEEFTKKLNRIYKDRALFHKLDISSEISVDKLIKNVSSRFSRIDVFINCAWPKTSDWIQNIEEACFDSIKENLIIHLGGYFISCKKMALFMKKQGFGSIINFSSIYGVVGPNFSIYKGTKMTTPPAYPLIKGGIIAMTKYFATYFAKDNIRINCISPGGVYDNHDERFVKKYEQLTPLGRMAKSDEIVGSTLFLASEKASSYVTGHCLMVDGGWTTW